jgi:hypothetical protein
VAEVFQVVNLSGWQPDDVFRLNQQRQKDCKCIDKLRNSNSFCSLTDIYRCVILNGRFDEAALQRRTTGLISNFGPLMLSNRYTIVHAIEI